MEMDSIQEILLTESQIAARVQQLGKKSPGIIKAKTWSWLAS